MSKVNKEDSQIETIYHSKLQNQFISDVQAFIFEDINLLAYINEEGNYCFYNYINNKIERTYKKVIKFINSRE
jgi:hypothetical protein